MWQRTPKSDDVWAICLTTSWINYDHTYTVRGKAYCPHITFGIRRLKIHVCFRALIQSVNSSCAHKSKRTCINIIMKISLFPLHPLFLFIISLSCSQTAIRESTHSPVFWYISTVLKYPHWSWKIYLPNCHISLVCCSCSQWQHCFLLELGRRKD